MGALNNQISDAPRQKRGNRDGRTLWIVIAILVCLVLAGGAYLLLRGGAPQPAPEEGKAIAEAFLAKLRQGDAASAWESTSAEFKSAEGKESFIRSSVPLGFLKEAMTFEKSEKVPIGKEFKTELVFRSQSGVEIRLLLAKEFGEWKVDRLTHAP